MDSTPFPEFLTRFPAILGEGAVIERLRREIEFELDPHIVNSAFIYEDEKRAALEEIYRQYIDIGRRRNLPVVLSTPTWRASRERIAAAGYEGKDVNGDNFRFLDTVRKSYGAYGKKVMICGLLSCRGNAYDQEEALTAAEAHEFHAWQAAKLAEAGVDFLLAATLPALSEALGLAQAMADTDRPYIVSFVFRPEGTTLDGTPLKDAISSIDETVRPRPLAFMANCTHASNFRSALLHETHASARVRERVIGLFANTAALKPEDLDNSEDLVSEAPDTFGRSVAALYGEFHMKVLGGCCGTDDRHIDHLAKRLASGADTV
jgi:homocysteine S-methyltransferase